MKKWKKMMTVMLILAVLVTSVIAPSVQSNAADYLSGVKSSLKSMQHKSYSVEIGLTTINLKEYLGAYASSYSHTELENEAISKNISFSSNNPTVASIDKTTGVMTLNQIGKTTITVKLQKKNYKITINVIKNDNNFVKTKSIINNIDALHAKNPSPICYYDGYADFHLTITEDQVIQIYNDCAAIYEQAKELTRQYKMDGNTEGDCNILANKGCTKTNLIVIPNWYLYSDLYSCLADYWDTYGHSYLSVENISYKMRGSNGNKQINVTMYLSHNNTYRVENMKKDDLVSMTLNGLHPLSMADNYSSITCKFNIYKQCSKCGHYHSQNLYTTATTTIKLGYSGMTLNLPKALKKGTYYIPELGKIVVK